MTPLLTEVRGYSERRWFSGTKFRNKTGVESVVLWHDESGAEMGGCHAPISRRSCECFARTTRSAGTAGTNPFDTAAIGGARPHDPARSRWHACACERTGTWCVAEDGAVLAQAVAAGGRGAGRGRAAGRCATGGSARDVHARAELRRDCDDLRRARRE